MPSSLWQSVFPRATSTRLAVIWAVVLAFLFGVRPELGPDMPVWLASLCFVALLSTIIYAAFGVVREADALSHQLGEPYGTLILTLSVVAIEVILIAAVLLGPGQTAEIAKDSIFSVMMIIMNLVMGLCLLLGAWKNGQQAYNAPGTHSYLGMIVLLGTLGLVLPNFLNGQSIGSGEFSVPQGMTLSVFVVLLYGGFLYAQMGPYHYLYIQPEKDAMEIDPRPKREKKRSTSFKLDAPTDGNGVEGIVRTPESLTAVRAAQKNEFQRSINLCQGAFVSTVGEYPGGLGDWCALRHIRKIWDERYGNDLIRYDLTAESMYFFRSENGTNFRIHASHTVCRLRLNYLYAVIRRRFFFVPLPHGN